ncbi:unnamed protein product, partial [Symbiodinium pilosum]
ILVGSASCATYTCPESCTPKPWPESLLCKGPTCKAQCCTCGGEEASAGDGLPDVGIQPCFSWQIGSSGTTPTAEQVLTDCGGASGYILAAFKENKPVVLHNIKVSTDTLQKVLQESASKAVSSEALGLTLESSKEETFTRFGFFCAGADCNLWKVPLGAKDPDSAVFAASQTGGLVMPQQVDTTLAIYNVTDPDELWVCPTEGAVESCGDGKITGIEECEGSSGEGCGSCQVMPGWACGGDGCEPLCGDGVMQGSETCDDGNNFQFDNCSRDCSLHTREVYVPFAASCAGEKVAPMVRVAKDGAASLKECQDLCSSDANCSAVEFYPTAWEGSVCHHFEGGILASLGQGAVEWQGSKCYIKAQYALVTEGLEAKSLDSMAAKCEEKQMKELAINNAQEVKLLYDFLGSS